jgi:hypothetical protein
MSLPAAFDLVAIGGDFAGLAAAVRGSVRLSLAGKKAFSLVAA